jgi:hypothetical protein
MNCLVWMALTAGVISSWVKELERAVSSVPERELRIFYHPQLEDLLERFWTWCRSWASAGSRVCSGSVYADMVRLRDGWVSQHSARMNAATP